MNMRSETRIKWGTKSILLFVPLLLFSCESSVLNSVVQLDEHFWLKLDESKLLLSEQLEIGFDKVFTDSRCPEDVICIWEGAAEIELWLLKSSTDTTFLSVTIPGFITSESEHHVSTDTLDYRITLLQLDPYPNTARERKLSDYRALLTISKF